MKKVHFVIIVVMALLVLTACNAPGGSTDTTAVEQTADTEVTAVPALRNVAEETTTETAVSHTGETEPVITYERLGGLKGIGPSEYVWRIYADGRVTSSQDQSWQVTPEEVDALLTSINLANFRTLNTSYIPEDTCCDRAQHTITIQTDGQIYKVATLDAADMPETLINTLATINTFLMALQ